MANIFKLIKFEYLKFGFSFMKLIIVGIISFLILLIFCLEELIKLYKISKIFDKVVLF